jgi:hypothetical protein
MKRYSTNKYLIFLCKENQTLNVKVQYDGWACCLQHMRFISAGKENNY